jgi:hypothetical protein
MSLIAVFELQASIPISLAQLQMESTSQKEIVFTKLLESGYISEIYSEDADVPEEEEVMKLFNRFLTEKYNVNFSQVEATYAIASPIFEMDGLIKDWASTGSTDEMFAFLMGFKNEENMFVLDALKRLLFHYTKKHNLVFPEKFK